MLRTTLIIILLIAFHLEAREINIEVKLENNVGLSTKDIEAKLKQIGLKKSIELLLNDLKLNSDLYQKVLIDKKYNEDEYLNHMTSFFSSFELIRISDSEPNNISNFNGVFKAQVDEELFKSKIESFVEDLEFLKEKNLYIDIDYLLVGNTKWDDLGVNSQSIFEEVIEKNFRDHLLQEFKDFKNIIFIREKDRQIIDNNKQLIPIGSFRYKYSFVIRKNFENSEKNQVSLEIDSHFVLVGAKDNKVILSFEFPIQKKILKNNNRKNLNSNIATIIFNLCKQQTESVKQKILKEVNDETPIFKLTGQRLFSEVYSVKSLLSTYLSKYNPVITIERLNLDSSDLKVSLTIDPKEDIKIQDLLLKMGKIPLSSDPNEKKLLIFDSEHNSFAITQKD